MGGVWQARGGEIEAERSLSCGFNLGREGVSPTRDVVTDSSAAVCEIFDSLIAGKLTRAIASYTVSE